MYVCVVLAGLFYVRTYVQSAEVAKLASETEADESSLAEKGEGKRREFQNGAKESDIY